MLRTLQALTIPDTAFRSDISRPDGRRHPLDPLTNRARFERDVALAVLDAGELADLQVARRQWRTHRPHFRAVVRHLRAVGAIAEAEVVAHELDQRDARLRPNRRAAAAVGTNLMLRVRNAVDWYTVLQGEEADDLVAAVLRAFGWLGATATAVTVRKRRANLATGDPSMLDAWKRRPRPAKASRPRPRR
jgi:hypothetical protein